MRRCLFSLGMQMKDSQILFDLQGRRLFLHPCKRSRSRKRYHRWGCCFRRIPPLIYSSCSRFSLCRRASSFRGNEKWSRLFSVKLSPSGFSPTSCAPTSLKYSFASQDLSSPQITSPLPIYSFLALSSPFLLGRELSYFLLDDSTVHCVSYIRHFQPRINR